MDIKESTQVVQNEVCPLDDYIFFSLLVCGMCVVCEYTIILAPG